MSTTATRCCTPTSVENAGGDQLPNETPTEVSGSSIDSGYQAFEYNPVYIDYANDTCTTTTR